MKKLNTVGISKVVMGIICVATGIILHITFPLVCLYFYALGHFTDNGASERLQIFFKRISKYLAFKKPEKIPHTILYFGWLNLMTQFGMGWASVSVGWGFFMVLLFGTSFLCGITSTEGNFIRVLDKIKETLSI